MNILAIDTSTEACSAALLRDDGAVFSSFEVAPRQHMRLLPQMMQTLLSDAGLSKPKLDFCAFANGPGAFTGIRIAAAQAQGIALGLGIPLLPISTLATLAQTGLDRYDCNRPLVALDARMQEIYCAEYERDESGLARLVGEERLCAVDAFPMQGVADYGIGHGWLESLRESAAVPVDAELLPDARSMLKLAQRSAELGQGISANQIHINYLRNKVAEKARG